MYSHSGLKVAEGFSGITVNCSRAIFFSSESLDQNRVLSLHLDLKITFSLQYLRSLSVVCLSLVLKPSEILPKYGKTNES